MNKLSVAKRAQILSMLVEGMSMRSITRITGASINTVTKLLTDAGNACAAYHDEHVRGITGYRRIECDEIWSFVYAKNKNVPLAKKAPEDAGDAWTWTAIDAKSKLILSYLVGGRDSDCALEFMDDIKARVENRVQMTTDGHKSYLEAVEDAFGADVDYAQLIKMYGAAPKEEQRRYSPSTCVGARKTRVTGNPEWDHISTSYVERHNLTMRMGMRRFTRLTNAFSKKMEKHVAMVNLYTYWYNHIRPHSTLRTKHNNRITPSMAAGLTKRPHTWDNLIELMDARAPKPKKPGPKPGTRYAPRQKSMSALL